jgi:exodeoxyribonuclease VII small subunit
VSEPSLGYEQAREELADVVRRLEAGGLSLEESLALWERGEELADVCTQWLEGARTRLDATRTEEDREPGGQRAGGSAQGPPAPDSRRR